MTGIDEATAGRVGGIKFSSGLASALRSADDKPPCSGAAAQVMVLLQPFLAARFRERGRHSDHGPPTTLAGLC